MDRSWNDGVLETPVEVKWVELLIVHVAETPILQLWEGERARKACPSIRFGLLSPLLSGSREKFRDDNFKSRERRWRKSRKVTPIAHRHTQKKCVKTPKANMLHDEAGSNDAGGMHVLFGL